MVTRAGIIKSMTPTMEDAQSNRTLPADDPQRGQLHNEVHARPSAQICLPALVVYVAVFNDGVTRDAECAHLQKLPGQQYLATESLKDNFLRLALDGYNVKWERHTEFTRYSIVQPLPDTVGLEGGTAELLTPALLLPPGWLARIPGRTVVAIRLAMVHDELADLPGSLQKAQHLFADGTLVAAHMGTGGHSCVMTDFWLRDDGFEHMLVLAPKATSETRAGRISQRLLELETYRLIALLGLPVAKQLAPILAVAEEQLAEIAARLERKADPDQDLLDTLVSLAARVESAIADNAYRFSATRAYDTLVGQRIAELREAPVAGAQTIGAFMQRRLSPAMATVVATSQRLTSLSERVARTSALLRTRVDIATEQQSRQLLEKLTRGQELQLRLQATVEGLSIAAISYYVVSLVLYAGKALKAAGLPLNPEVAAGVSIPLVLWAVWRATRHIHAKIIKR